MLHVGRVAGRVLLSVLVAVLCMTPLPECVMALHPEFRQWFGCGRGVPFALGCLVSVVQLRMEYWLVSQPAVSTFPKLREWWQGSQICRNGALLKGMFMPDWLNLWPLLKPFLTGTGYIGMAVCSMNPVPGTPFCRTAAVAIWRSSHLRGSGILIAACSLVRLVIVYPMVDTIREKIIQLVQSLA
jgi:hypothetical protein